MTNHQHPITPPPKLVQQWVDDFAPLGMLPLCIQAANWGADQELQACINFVYDNELCDPDFHNNLCAFRRPKPPSLKELALARTDAILNDPNRALLTEVRETLELNRRALEQLDD